MMTRDQSLFLRVDDPEINFFFLADLIRESGPILEFDGLSHFDRGPESDGNVVRHMSPTHREDREVEEIAVLKDRK